jgi:hypothetical protein
MNSIFSRFSAALIVPMLLASGAAIGQDGADSTVPSELRQLLQQRDLKLAVAGQPLQMRTAYAVGGVSKCETVISASNFSSSPVRVEVEFFTGFNAFQRGIAIVALNPGETGELATTDAVEPFVINAVRDSSVPFEGYANIHAETPEIGAHAHLVCHVGGEESYETIKVFRARENRPVQQGD